MQSHWYTMKRRGVQRQCIISCVMVKWQHTVIHNMLYAHSHTRYCRNLLWNLIKHQTSYICGTNQHWPNCSSKLPTHNSQFVTHNKHFVNCNLAKRNVPQTPRLSNNLRTSRNIPSNIFLKWSLVTLFSVVAWLAHSCCKPFDILPISSLPSI